MVLLVLLTIFTFTQAVSDVNVIQTAFDYDVADDMVQVAVDCYNQGEHNGVGDHVGRDKNWVAQIVLSPKLEGNIIDGYEYTEGYVYTHETAVGSDGKKICAIGVQGTDSVSDILTDLTVGVVEIKTKGDDESILWVHQGVITRLRDIVSQEGLLSYIRDDCSTDVLYLAGHSLGGALVQLWALAMMQGFKTMDNSIDWTFDMDPIPHNVQAYTFSGMKIFSMPFSEVNFPLQESIWNGVRWYQENIPCPKGDFFGNHVHRIFTSTRSGYMDASANFIVDYVVVNHLYALFRFCSQAYELDLYTGILTKDDVYSPDFNNWAISYDINYHSSINHIQMMHAPLKAYVHKTCAAAVDPTDETMYDYPGIKRKVRCCKTQTSGDVSCTSRSGVFCSGLKTYPQAKTFCTDLGEGYDICDKEQVSSCCGFWQNSCYYDDYEVWLKYTKEKETTDTAVSVYPEFDEKNEHCRGFKCEITKYGILYFNNDNHPNAPNTEAGGPIMPKGPANSQLEKAEAGKTAEEEQVGSIGSFHQDVQEQLAAETHKVLKEFKAKKDYERTLENMAYYAPVFFAGVLFSSLTIYFWDRSKKKSHPTYAYEVAAADEAL